MKILMVDDESDARVLFTQRFRKEIAKNELQFTFAGSGNEALGYLNNQEQDIKIILSDINMPGMSGLELLEKIKQRPDTPSPFIMMISAYGDEENINRSVNLGADDFLTKPLDFGILKEKIKTILQQNCL
jgi:CheY-like chemotaxis protein